jgi:hypothetical protein
MITQETHRIDWHKAAQMIGVVLLSVGKAAWWIAKKGWALLVAILRVLVKFFVALVSVWASISESSDDADDRYAKPGELGYNDAGEPGYGPEYRYKRFS